MSPTPALGRETAHTHANIHIHTCARVWRFSKGERYSWVVQEVVR